MAITVGSVIVALEARTAAFMRDFDKASRRVERFTRDVERTAAIISTALGGAFVIASRQANQFGAEMARASRRLGVSAQFLSEFKPVVESVGISFEQFADMIQDQSERLADALVADGGEARDAVKALGLDLDELLSLGGSAAMEKLITELAKVEDVSTQIFLADKLWADAGQALVGVIRQGTEAIQRQREAAQELGLTITDDAAAAAEQLNMRMMQLRRVGEGFVNQAQQALTPSLNQIAQAFLNTGSAANFGAETGIRLGKVMLQLVETGARVAQAFQNAGEFIGAFAAGIGARLRGNVEGLEQTLDDFFSRSEERNERFNRFVEDLRTPPQAPDLVFGAVVTPDVVTTTRQLQERLQGVETARRSLTEAQREAARIAQENLQLTRDARSPLEQLRDTYDDLRSRLDAGGISQRTFNFHLAEAQQLFKDQLNAAMEFDKEFEARLRAQADAMEEANRRMMEARQRTERMLFRTLQRGLDGLLDGTKTVKEAFRDLVADITRQLTRLAAQEAFRNLFNKGLGGAGAGVGGGGGFTDFFSGIFGLFGFRNGGSFTVGGNGGPDSQTVAFRATPGERVTVTPPGKGGMEGVQIVQHLHFQGRPDALMAQQLGAQTAVALREAASRNA